MGSAAIHPRWEVRKRLAVEGVGWISHRNFTRHLVKEWGFSLGLIPLMDPIGQRPGWSPENRRY